MGIVDVLAKDGEGEAAVQAWIAKNARRRSGHQAVMRVRQQVNPVTRDELDAIADIWVDCALRLEDRDLRMMSRVVRAQMERMEAAAAPERPPAVPAPAWRWRRAEPCRSGCEVRDEAAVGKQLAELVKVDAASSR